MSTYMSEKLLNSCILCQAEALGRACFVLSSLKPAWKDHRLEEAQTASPQESQSASCHCPNGLQKTKAQAAREGRHFSLYEPEARKERRRLGEGAWLFSLGWALFKF